ncbi:hypothetical protein [Variovorax sp. UC74_104]|uniref:hypothetical protein n=1 Tax=Variovorax sp. UC74_104 TaxID=3374555 RepID=UPI0037564212
MRIDRELQLHILEVLREVYPDYDKGQLLSDKGDGSGEDERIVANLVYLEEHGLVKSGITFSITGAALYDGARITAAGLDFLADDGGLTAVLGTVIVKLHADTIRDLMLAKVEAAQLPAEEKSRLKKAITTLSTEALKEAAKKLVSAGMDNAPDAIALLRTLLGI